MDWFTLSPSHRRFLLVYGTCSLILRIDNFIPFSTVQTLVLPIIDMLAICYRWFFIPSIKDNASI